MISSLDVVTGRCATVGPRGVAPRSPACAAPIAGARRQVQARGCSDVVVDARGSRRLRRARAGPRVAQKRRVLNLLALALCSAGGASIIGGEPAPDDLAVVAIVGDGGSVPYCSGVLVAPDRVLTAGHCLYPPGDALVLPTHVVVVRDRTRIEEVAVAWAATPPSFDRTTLEADVAVLGLAAPVTATAPVALATDDLGGAAARAARWIGFGFDQPGPQGTLGARNSVTAAIGAVEASVVIGPPVTCNGDSGGAVLVDDGAGERLIAVVSAGGPGCTLYSKATRLDVVADWLAPWLAGASAVCEPDAACVAGCAEADADCACPADGTCAACAAGADDPDCVAPGDLCATDRDCLGECVDGVCHAACDGGAACPAGDTCVDDPAHGPICVPTAGGCSSAPAPGALAALALLLLFTRPHRERKPR